jgi:hypothetical protein
LVEHCAEKLKKMKYRSPEKRVHNIQAEKRRRESQQTYENVEI